MVKTKEKAKTKNKGKTKRSRKLQNQRSKECMRNLRDRIRNDPVLYEE